MTAVIATPTDRHAAVWRDRSTHWSIALGPLRVARSTTQVRYIGPVAHPYRSSSTARALLMWGLAALVLAGCLTWGFAAQASAQRPRFVTPIIDIIEQAPAPTPARLSKTHSAAPSPQPAVAKILAEAPDDASNFDRFPAVRRAIEAAFQTGEAQDWAEGDYQGLVVAGAPYAEGGKTCRETAILLRDGGFDGTTKSTVTCHVEAGRSEG